MLRFARAPHAHAAAAAAARGQVARVAAETTRPAASAAAAASSFAQSVPSRQQRHVTARLHARSFSSFTPSHSPSSVPSASSLPSPLRQLIESAWLMAGGAPKGWERFFPPGRGAQGRASNNPEHGGTTSETGGRSGSEKAGSGSGSGSGSGGSSGGPRRSAPSAPPSPPAWVNALIAATGAYAFYRLTLALTGADDSRELTYQDFKTRFLERGLVDRLEVDPTSKQVSVFLKAGAAAALAHGANGGVANLYVDDDQQRNGTSAASSTPSSGIPSSVSSGGDPHYYFFIGSVESFERSLAESQRDLNIPPHEWVSVRYMSSNSGGGWLPILLQVGFYGAIFWMIKKTAGGMGVGGMGGGGKGGKNPFSFGKSTAQLIKPGESKVTFADVAGLDEAKVEVMEFVKFLQAPDKFTRLGAKIPKGALLQGPPGTGKTLLAKAVAGEAGVPFFSISGSDFLEMFVGVGPSRVRDLFAQARASSPSIIFIDEIDAVGRARSKHGGTGGGNDERENTLNQLLVEMDGMGTTEGVVVLAGTNRKDMLDKALLRPGRFDRHITIDKPDMKGRAQIFMVHLKPLKTDAKHTLEDLSQRLAALTPGFAGADIANLCNEAALIAARADKEAIQLVDFELASDRVIGGLEKKSSKMSVEEKSLVAHHEAGHAVAAWFLEHADPLLKVTIVPRTSGALGFAQYLPKELTLYHQGQLSDMMAMALGGRAAEQIFFGRVSTGASDDLQKVTRIAQAQVTTYGMSARLGQVSYAPGQDESSQFVRPYSEATAQAIDEEVRGIIAATYERTLALLEKHRVQVSALAQKLIELENVNHDVLLEILGPRPFASDAYTTWRKQAQEAAAEAAAAKKEAEEKKRLAEPQEGLDLSPA